MPQADGEAQHTLSAIDRADRNLFVLMQCFAQSLPAVLLRLVMSNLMALANYFHACAHAD